MLEYQPAIDVPIVLKSKKSRRIGVRRLARLISLTFLLCWMPLVLALEALSFGSLNRKSQGYSTVRCSDRFCVIQLYNYMQ